MKRPLLLTLGTSPAIAIQAYLLETTNIDSVHMISTDNRDTDYSLLEDYFSQAGIDFTIDIIKGYSLMTSERDHLVYEESLLRWYWKYTPTTLPIVYADGGLKNMVIAMQKAAQWLGAYKVYHILVNQKPFPSNPEEIIQAIREKKILKLDLGAEPGWPAFRKIGQSFPVEIDSKEDGSSIYFITPPAYFSFYESIQSVLGQVQSQLHGKKLTILPFNSLNLLPANRQFWLNQPLDEKLDRNWILNLPKLDLHCHLGGFATGGDLLKKVREAACNPERLPGIKVTEIPTGWPFSTQPINLRSYMQLGDDTGSALLKDPGCLQMHIELMYQHFLEQGLRYVEVRCSPDNYRSEYRSSWDVLDTIISCFQKMMDQCRHDSSYCHVNLILIASRKIDGDRSSISRHLALAITAAQHQEKLPDEYMCKVVGVDLAGFESVESRAGYFETDFVPVHRCGLAVTAHAGENDDAEGIWQAVFRLNVRRIGHGLRLLDAPELLKSVAERGIGVEMCPFANYQIKGFKPMEQVQTDYPLRLYLKNNVLVSVNTDNIGISAASISDNLLFLTRLCPGLTRLEVLQLIRNSVETSFSSKKLKSILLKDMEMQVFNACM